MDGRDQPTAFHRLCVWRVSKVPKRIAENQLATPPNQRDCLSPVSSMDGDTETRK